MQTLYLVIVFRAWIFMHHYERIVIQHKRASISEVHVKPWPWHIHQVTSRNYLHSAFLRYMYRVVKTNVCQNSFLVAAIMAMNTSDFEKTECYNAVNSPGPSKSHLKTTLFLAAYSKHSTIHSHPALLCHLLTLALYIYCIVLYCIGLDT